MKSCFIQGLLLIFKDFLELQHHTTCSSVLLLKLLNNPVTVNDVDVSLDKQAGEELNLFQVFMKLIRLILFHILAELHFSTNISVIMRNTGCFIISFLKGFKGLSKINWSSSPKQFILCRTLLQISQFFVLP